MEDCYFRKSATDYDEYTDLGECKNVTCENCNKDVCHHSLFDCFYCTRITCMDCIGAADHVNVCKYCIEHPNQPLQNDSQAEWLVKVLTSKNTN